jgi:hypothetical protein
MLHPMLQRIIRIISIRCINGSILIFVKKDSAETAMSMKLSSPLMDSIEVKID